MKKNLFLFFVLFVIFSCSDTMAKYEPYEGEALPDMTQDNYEHYIYKNNHKYLSTFITHADFYETENRISCKGLSATVYNSKNEITTVITSETGEINQKNKQVEFTGSVVIKSYENETTMSTEKLVLDYKNNKMFNDVPITIMKDNGSSLSANSMRADIQTKKSNFTDMHIIYYYDTDEKNPTTNDDE